MRFFGIDLDSFESVPSLSRKTKAVIGTSVAAIGIYSVTKLYISYVSQKVKQWEEEELNSLDSDPYKSLFAIKTGMKFYEYPDILRANWYLSYKYLRKYPLSYTIAKNGNKIYYNEFGDPNGFPLLHFHGSGGSNNEGIIYDELAKKYNFHLIVLDRPGHGQSTFDDKNYNFEEYAKDLVIFLKNVFDIGDSNDRIGVTGSSQGAIFAISMLALFNKLKKEIGININVELCIIFAGLPVTDIDSLLLGTGNTSDKYNDGGEDKMQLRQKYLSSIPKGIIDNYNLSKNEWLNAWIGDSFAWYMYYENFYKNKDKLNYNWAIQFLKNSDLLPPCDVSFLNNNDLLKGHVFNCKYNSRNSEDKSELRLNTWYFSKEQGKHSYFYQKQKGERFTVKSQWNLPFTFNDIGSDIPIYWYHGIEDKLIPIEWVRVFQNHLINKCNVNIIRNELENTGHLSLFSFQNFENAYFKARKLLDDKTHA